MINQSLHNSFLLYYKFYVKVNKIVSKRYLKKKDKHLHVIELRGLGKNNNEISEKLDTTKYEYIDTKTIFCGGLHGASGGI